MRFLRSAAAFRPSAVGACRRVLHDRATSVRPPAGASCRCECLIIPRTPKGGRSRFMAEGGVLGNGGDLGLAQFRCRRRLSGGARSHARTTSRTCLGAVCS
jgi:hypothetical protein